MTARSVSWTGLAALSAVALFVATVMASATRSFWYDEVFTLGASAIGRPLDWQVLLADVHPPTYALAVRTLGAVFGPDAFALRLVNLPAALAATAAIGLLWRQLGTGRTLVLICLLLANAQVLSLAVDLRSYALLMGFAALAQALLVTDRLGPAGRIGWLIPTAAVLTALHFFGAAIGLACLGLAVLRAGACGARAAALGGTLAAAVLTAGILYWAFGISQTSAALGGNLWIANTGTAYVAFAGAHLPLMLLGLLLIAVRARPPAAALISLGAPLMVVGVGMVISLHSPVISGRNLAVCMPGLAIAAVLTIPGWLLERLDRSPLVLLVIALFAGREGWLAAGHRQMIDWTITAAAPPACAGAPIYVARPGVVYDMAQQVFLGEVRRPVLPIHMLEGPLTLPDGCRAIAIGWHELGPVAEVAAFVESRGIPARTVLPPVPYLAERGTRSHGFVIELRD